MTPNTTGANVIILGGGAAGLMCAIEAGKRGRSVLVLERNDRIGEKIRISGGGRCNFTNIGTTPENFLSSNPHFPRSALARYTPDDFTALLKRHGIGYHEKKLGQLFCDHGAQDIILMLESEARVAGVSILTGCEIRDVQKNTYFEVSTSSGAFTSDSLVIATGGLSIPKIGATDFGYHLAKRFGLNVVGIFPALVPFTLSPAELTWTAPLSGISVDTVVSTDKKSFRENFLFTHRGLSGPAILQISSYWSTGMPVTLDLSPNRELQGLFAEERKSDIDVATLLATIIPKRLAKAWCGRLGIAGPMKTQSDLKISEIAAGLHRWEIIPAGTEGFGKAEVTRGGVDTDDLSSKTMEVKNVPGLYVIGEVMDVTGELGGYNFQWAWASGFAAGQFV